MAWLRIRGRHILSLVCICVNLLVSFLKLFCLGISVIVGMILTCDLTISLSLSLSLSLSHPSLPPSGET